MAHSKWCGNVCNECNNPCELDLNMLCSPDCKAINPEINIADKKFCIKCGDDLIKISLDEALEVIYTRNPIGKFYIEKDEDFYVGIDNTTGDAWIEDFKSKEECFRWLYGEEKEYMGGNIAM